MYQPLREIKLCWPFSTHSIMHGTRSKTYMSFRNWDTVNINHLMNLCKSLKSYTYQDRRSCFLCPGRVRATADLKRMQELWERNNYIRIFLRFYLRILNISEKKVHFSFKYSFACPFYRPLYFAVCDSHINPRKLWPCIDILTIATYNFAYPAKQLWSNS
jgi:hypothetical protein